MEPIVDCPGLNSQVVAGTSFYFIARFGAVAALPAETEPAARCPLVRRAGALAARQRTDGPTEPPEYFYRPPRIAASR